MLILLPPSETKNHTTRGRPMRPGDTSFPDLEPMRALVAEHLGRVSASPQAAAVLKTGSGTEIAREIEHNTRLANLPALPVSRLYTGVLYDQLDLAGLSGAALRRANSSIVVISALYGALRLKDRVAPYRLSMGITLPGVGGLAAAWRPHLDAPLTAAAGRGLIVDCRSSTYAAAWTPAADLTSRWVQVAVPGVSHATKHTRGQVARHVCMHGAGLTRPGELVELLAGAFTVRLRPPQRTTAPWVLEVSADPGCRS